jgi:small subunit ribosomal protein S8
MSVDSVGNFFTSLRNAIMRGKQSVLVPHSRFKVEIASILLREGFIKNFEVKDEKDNFKMIEVALKYVHNESAIHELTFTSTPGRRRYVKGKQIPHIKGGFGIAVISTSKGVKTDKEARVENIGGEMVCTVW